MSSSMRSMMVAAPSNGASWFRVAAGIRLVAQAGASLATTEAAKQSHLALGHAIQIIQSAQKQHQHQQQQQQQRHQQQEPWPNVPPATPSSFTQARRSTIDNVIRQSSTDSTGSATLNNDAATLRKTPPPSSHSAATDFSSPTSATTTIKMADSPLASASVPRSMPTLAQKQQQQPQHNEEDVINLLEEGRAVPSTRVGRAFGFAQLGLGLALGTAKEGLSRLFDNSSSTSGSSSSGGGGVGSSSSIAMNDANADRLAASLCRMRGAALKMGQMLSIQDESLLPPALTRALHQVRQGAEAMPARQLEAQLVQELGPDWRDLFVSFEDRPFAAASVGQVHRAKILVKSQDASSDHQNDHIRNVVVKVQYPGVANSIESDLRNLGMLVQWSGLSPPGLFLENVIRVGSKEMKVECNYLHEMNHQRRLRELVHADDFLHVQNKFVVPDVVPDLTTQSIITSEYLLGGTIDKVANLNQEERNRIGRAIMYLTMQELFVWRFMQTDPNWGNFLYNVGTGTTGLIDFGASREYSKDFVDGYLRIVWASANRDEKTLMEQSHRMNFLTGHENKQMLQAHKLSGFTVGEPFYSSDHTSFTASAATTDRNSVPLFDFRGSNISSRMGAHTAVFMQHRLTAPPEEVYTLHRKLAGAYMLCIKLGAIIPCRDLLSQIVENYKFDDGQPHPMATSSHSTGMYR